LITRSELLLGVPVVIVAVVVAAHALDIDSLASLLTVCVIVGFAAAAAGWTIGGDAT